MVESDPIAHLRQTLADLVSWFEAARTDGIVVGGVAASILGRPRATRDVDAIIWLDEPDWPFQPASPLLRGSRNSVGPAPIAPNTTSDLAFTRCHCQQ